MGVEMGKLGVAILSFLIGLAGGAVLVGPMIGGAMAGAGAGVGLSTGTCLTVKAATELGYLSDEQVDEVLTKAAEDVSSQTVSEGQEIVGSAAACREALEKLNIG